MGDVATKICGGASPLDWLIKQYGDDIGKFIAIEKVKQFLDGKILNLKDLVGKQSGGLLQQFTGTVDGKKVQLTNTFQQYKQLINDQVPGGVNMIQTTTKKPIQEILGLNGFLQKFDQVKTTAVTRFNEQQKNVMTTIDQTGQQQKQLLNSQRPKVPLYDQLPEKQQQLVFKEGQRVFANQIQSQQDNLVKQMGDKLVPEAYLGVFKNLIPTGSLDGILANARNTFQQVKNGSFAAGGLGNIGNMARNFFG